MPIKFVPSLAFVSLGFAHSWLTPALAQNYTLTDLGSSTNYYSEAHGLNGLGHVGGEYESTNSLYVRGFYYDGAAMIDVGSLSGQHYAVAYGINDTDEVVGESDNGSNTHAFLNTNGIMTDLGILGGHANMGGYSSARAINRLQQAVGESSVSFDKISTIHAVLFEQGTVTDLGALGGDYSAAFAINNSGMIAGESDVVEAGVTNVHAFVYSGGIMGDLGTLGGNYSSAKGINDSGVIVGEAEALIAGVTYLHAFTYNGNSLNDLGTLGGSTSSASAINSSGAVVGYATDINEVANAFLFDGSSMINLTTLIPPGSAFTNLASADAINDAGQIAGSGYLADGEYHAYLLTPPALQLSVLITNPGPNARFQAPASFAIGATASDSTGSVTNVQFLVNAAVVGNSSSVPYSANATNLPAGSYTLTAIAADDIGVQATNSITVTVSDAPPTVSITNPAPNTAFQAPATFVVSASASDPDGSITNVEFLVNGAPIGNATTSPYRATASDLVAAAYTLTAVASDGAGLMTTNQIAITVTNAAQLPAFSLSNPAWHGHSFSFAFPSQVGYTYSGQYATPLDPTNNWVTFTNVSGNGSVLQVTDPYATNDQRFYRVVAH
jgi:probable HAF family extracellular repeat protein